MTARGILFDIGGVLEHVGPPTWRNVWADRLGLGAAEFDAAIGPADLDPLALVGRRTEAELRDRYAARLDLRAGQAQALMADFWDWYCGKLDHELVSYVRRLRPRWRTGILSNSIDGARREERRRYRLPDLVDEVVYSHEVGLAKPDPAIFRLACERLGVPPTATVFVDNVPANVDAAARLGIQAIRHRDTKDTIKTLDALITEGQSVDTVVR